MRAGREGMGGHGAALWAGRVSLQEEPDAPAVTPLPLADFLPLAAGLSTALWVAIACAGWALL